MVERGRSVHNADNFVDRRERISDEEMGNLLAAFGNHEAKALTLVLMQPDTIYTKSDLHRLVIQSQGKTPSWKISRDVPFKYCFHSLAPIGLVAREITDRVVGTFGYEKTEYGKRVGDSLASALLEFSLNNALSLHQVFGSSLSPSTPSDIEIEGEVVKFRKRAPLTRLKIIKAILGTNSKTNIISLAREIDEEIGIVGRHVRDLARLGVIVLRSSGSDEKYSFFRAVPSRAKDQPEPYYGYRTLTRAVLDAVRAEPDRSWNNLELANKLVSSSTDKNLRHKASDILNYLEGKGYLEQVGFSNRRQSEIGLTPERRIELKQLIEILNSFQNQDTSDIERWSRLAGKFRAGSMVEEIVRLMEKARETSPFANMDHKIGDVILGIIRDNPSKKPSEIRRILEREYGKNLSYDAVRVIIKNLERDRLVIREKGRANSSRLIVNPQALSESSNSSQAVV